MQKTFLGFILAFGFLSVSCEKKPQTESEKTLFAFGTKLGSNLKSLKFSKSEIEWVALGFEQSALGEIQKNSGSYFEDVGMNEKIQKMVDSKRDAEKIFSTKVGKDFYEKFLAGGAIKTDSGLAYRTLKEGSGENPSATDIVEIHYQVSLPNGKVVQSTKVRGEPSMLPTQTLLKGWGEGVKLMRVGGQAQLVLPPDLAYGDYGNPPEIPGGSYLILDIELLSVKPMVPVLKVEGNVELKTENRKAVKREGKK
jgi:FKBP-type peptidyl-prolyl cis-trans isomerase FkpA